MWDHLPLEELHPTERDTSYPVHRNMLGLQRTAAIKQSDQRLAELGVPTGAYEQGDVDELLEHRYALVELLRTGPHA